MRQFLCVVVLGLLSAPISAERDISFVAGQLPEDGSIVIPFIEANGLSGVASAVNARTDGALEVAVQEAGFVGAMGTNLSLFGIAPYTRIDLIGVGSERLTRTDAENFGGNAAALNNGASGTRVQIVWQGVDRDADATASRVALGFRLGAYHFDRYLQDKLDPDSLSDVVVVSDDDGAAFDSDLSMLADAIYLARDLSTEPGNVIYPQSFIDRVRNAFDGVRSVRFKVLDEKDMDKLGMGAHLGVGRGSTRPPRVLIIEYLAGGSAPSVVLAGKGITFDTGGISLKPKQNMGRMKADMTGAAVVSATVLAAARREAPVNVVAIAALAENMPSGSAIRPGDILTSMSGKTIEINSTDAEGRLVLSDTVYYAQREYQPDVLIDVATLTGSVYRAVGPDYAGLFSRHETLATQLLAAAEAAGEPAWHLPLDDVHFERIQPSAADVINGGIPGAGASIGAAFIGSFVDESQVWAHFDIASVDFMEEARPTVPEGYSAWGVRMLDEYLRRHHMPNP
ncbi:MAG: leucyl aminopeptidase family protein [Pseudomonadota bacterium]